jgi:hypothetical protein
MAGRNDAGCVLGLDSQSRRRSRGSDGLVARWPDHHPVAGCLQASWLVSRAASVRSPISKSDRRPIGSVPTFGACVLLAPLAVAVAVRWPAAPHAGARRNPPLALSVIVASSLLVWDRAREQVWSSCVRRRRPCRLTPVPHAAAVSMLLSSCYAVVRLNSVYAAARRASRRRTRGSRGFGGMRCLPRGQSAPALWRAAARDPLLRLTRVGSAVHPRSPILDSHGGPRPVLPASAQLETRSCCSVSVFSIALAAVSLRPRGDAQQGTPGSGAPSR